MQIEIKTLNHNKIAAVFSKEVIMTDSQSALDFIMSMQYETGTDRVAGNKAAISEQFFILSTGIAGEILQKFVNYHIKFAIYGDFAPYTSKALKDFIYECNNGNDIFFVNTKEEALQRLAKAV